MKHLNIYLSCAFICIFGIANAQIVTTLAGSTTAGSGNGTGTAAGLNWPIGVAADNSGNLYVADYNNNQIRKIVISSGVVTTLAGSTTGGSNNGTGTAASFSAPTGVACDGLGNLYVADYGNNLIRKIVISSGVVTTLAGSGASGSGNGTGTAASFSEPSAVVADRSGNLYVADQLNNEIRQIVISSGVVTTLAGSTTAGTSNGTGTAAKFSHPIGVTTDDNGNLYVADYYNDLIRKIVISSGVVTTVAGPTGFGGTWGIAADSLGNVYVGDAGQNRIDRVVVSTGAISHLAGSGASGSTNAMDTLATFNAPCGVCMDKTGNLYVADRNNNEVRMITGVLGINEINVSEKISAYPNPVSKTLYLSFSQPLVGGAMLKIMDITGKELSSQYIRKVQGSQPVDVSLLPVGLYFVSIENGNGVVLTQKFVKQ